MLSYYARKEAKEVAGVIDMKTCTGMTASYDESGKLELLLATTMKGAKKEVPAALNLCRRGEVAYRVEAGHARFVPARFT